MIRTTPIYHALRYTLLVFVLCVIFSKNLHAQDPNFSQFYNNPIYYNPGMTAIGNGLAWRINARNLWGPIPGKFNTYCASIDAEAINKTGLGFLAYSDVAGEGLLRTQGSYLSYAYRPVETNKFIIQAGLSGGLVYKNIDWSRFTFSDQLDEVFGTVRSSAFVNPGKNNVLYPDFGAGIAARFNGGKNEARDRKITTTLGFAFHHLTKPRDAFINDGGRLPLKWLVHGQSNILLNNIVYGPGFIFEKQNQFQTFTVGMNVYKKPIFMGIWFRNRTYTLSLKSYDSFIFNLGLNSFLNKKTRMRVTYGYDFTVSRLKTAAFGTHEISLIFEFDDKVFLRNYQDKQKQRQKNKFKVCVDF